MAGLIQTRMAPKDNNLGKIETGGTNGNRQQPNGGEPEVTTMGAGGGNNQSQTTPAPTDTPAYDPERMDMDPATDTVEGRAQGIIDRNSPLMQSARTRANQQSNKRGTLNSSMATGAAQRAVLDAALPIAQQDAQTSVQIKGRNQQAGNEALGMGAQRDIEMGMMDREAELQAERDERQHQLETDLQELRGTQAEDLARLENEFGTMRQASESAASFYNQNAQAIGNILNNPKLGRNAREAMVQKQLELLEGGLNVVGSINNLDLTELLDFTGRGNPNNPDNNTPSIPNIGPNPGEAPQEPIY